MYETKKYESLIGLTGFSDQLLKNHFTLYEGYVTNVNKLTDSIVNLMKEDKIATPEFAELTRRYGWEFNGMRLHEFYFGNLVEGGTNLNTDSAFYKKFITEFGSMENWEKHFRAVGSMRGIGWVILYYDQQSQKMFNMWINEHDSGHPAGCTPLLIMDVFEHAYMLDYGVKKADYLNVFIPAIDWQAVAARF
jgi:Fe-Mn family superoxide dismutase